MISRACRILFAAIISICLAGGTGAAFAAPVKNIVLVHGAWVDGSGWKPVYEILTKDGYNVTLVQEPLTSFQDDVIATKRILDLQDGPCILVGHSYGGSIITEAGVHPKVVGLVYVAAHAPNVGEDEGALGKRTPSVLAQQKVQSRSRPTASRSSIRRIFRYSSLRTCRASRQTSRHARRYSRLPGSSTRP